MQRLSPPGFRSLMTELPLRADLVGERPYGAPTDDVPVRLNVNENPYPPPPPVVADLTAAVAAELVRLNRYPDREAAQLRDALAAYVGVAASCQRIRRCRARSSCSVCPMIFRAIRIARSHEVPNSRIFRSAVLISRDSDARIASADAGLSDWTDRYCGGRPVIEAACFAISWSVSV